MEDKPQKQCVIPIHKPSPRELIFFFLCGIIVSVPNALIFEQFSSFLPYALTVIVVAPFVEEFAKVLPLFYRHGETEKSIVTLGILIGLGFGITEFALYVFVYDVPWFVRIPGIIFHASSAGVTAYGIAKKKPLPYYLTSVFLHAANNFFAVVAPGNFGVLAELLILVTVYLLAWRLYHQASDEKMVV